MATAHHIRIVPEVAFWPEVPTNLYRLDPPLEERDTVGTLLDTHEYVLAWIQPEFRDTQASEAIMIAATAEARPKGSFARPIAKYSQSSWEPNLAGLFFINGYTIEEG